MRGERDGAGVEVDAGAFGVGGVFLGEGGGDEAEGGRGERGEKGGAGDEWAEAHG